MESNFLSAQAHQYRNGCFEIRTVSSVLMPDDFERLIDATWKTGMKDDPKLHKIVHVDDIPLGPSGKYLELSSDLFVDTEPTALGLDHGLATRQAVALFDA